MFCKCLSRDLKHEGEQLATPYVALRRWCIGAFGIKEDDATG